MNYFHIFLFLGHCISSLNITVLKQEDPYTKYIALNQNELSYVEKLNNFGQIMSVEFQGAQDICSTLYQGMNIHQLPYGYIPLIKDFSQKSIDEVTAESLFIGPSEVIVNYIKDESQGIAILSSTGVIYYVKMNNTGDIVQTKMLLSQQLVLPHGQYQHLLYDDKSKYFIYIQENYATRFYVANSVLVQEVVQGWIQPKQDFVLSLQKGWLYSSESTDGLIVYSLENNILMLAKIINSEDLYGNTTQIDIAEAIPVGDRVYVLDRLHGISQFLNYFNGTFIRNPKFKMIPVTESTKSFSIKGNTMIIISQMQTYSTIIELYLENDEWIEMRRLENKSKMRKAEIFDQFTIIRGLHNHKIMFTKMHDQCMAEQSKRQYDLKYSYRDNYFFSGNLIGLDAFNDDGIIFAISPHSFYLYNYKPYPSIIICNSNIQPKKYNFDVLINSTDCSAKTNKSDILTVCQSLFHYEMNVQRPLLTPEQQSMYMFIAFICGGVALALCLLVVCLYRRYKVQQEYIQIIVKNRNNRQQYQQQQQQQQQEPKM